eukprot:202726-Chlamydomonas_euryale.AAC.7
MTERSCSGFRLLDTPARHEGPKEQGAGRDATQHGRPTSRQGAGGGAAGGMAGPAAAQLTKIHSSLLIPFSFPTPRFPSPWPTSRDTAA